MSTYSLRDSFKTERLMLIFVGLYPLTPNAPPFLHFLNLFSGIITITIGVCQFLSMFIQMIIDINDLSKVTETLFFFITHTTYMSKVVNFLYYRKNMLEIENSLTQSIFYFPENRMKILKKKIEGRQHFLRAFKIMCFMAVTLMGLLPYLDESKSKSLPLSGWQPYNATLYYYPTACFQILALSYTATNNVNFDCTFWILVTLASGEFDILKENLRNIDYKQETKLVEKEFINCVKHHEATVRFVREIESTFSKGIFLNFLSSVVVTCFTGFMMVIVPFLGLQFFFLALYLACMTAEFAAYCWCGHDVIVTSDEIGRAFHMSNWYESHLSLCKSLVIFLERTKKPVILTGGKIVTLSLPTFTGILRSSYSYFAVLQRIYNGE